MTPLQPPSVVQSAKNVERPGLGPGSYDVRDVEQLGRARSRKNIMVSSQARFTDPSSPSSNNPGPGYYGTGMVYGNLLKQVGAYIVSLYLKDMQGISAYIDCTGLRSFLVVGAGHNFEVSCAGLGVLCCQVRSWHSPEGSSAQLVAKHTYVCIRTY